MDFTKIDLAPYWSEWLEGDDHMGLIFDADAAVFILEVEGNWFPIAYAERRPEGFFGDASVTPTMIDVLRQTLDKVLPELGHDVTMEYVVPLDPAPAAPSRLAS